MSQTPGTPGTPGSPAGGAPQGPQPQGGQQQYQIRVDESKMQTVYANTIRTSSTADELVLDFGINLPHQQGQDGQIVMNFAVGSRVVMNWVAAKRLLMSLSQAVGNFEKRFGEIDVNARRPEGGEQQG